MYTQGLFIGGLIGLLIGTLLGMTLAVLMAKHYWDHWKE